MPANGLQNHDVEQMSVGEVQAALAEPPGPAEGSGFASHLNWTNLITFAAAAVVTALITWLIG